MILNDNAYDINNDNIRINEFFENIKISVQSIIQEDIINNYFYLNSSIDCYNLEKNFHSGQCVYLFIQVIQPQAIVRESSMI